MNAPRSQYLSALGIVQYRPRVEGVVGGSEELVEPASITVNLDKPDLNKSDKDKSDKPSLGRQHLSQLATELDTPVNKVAVAEGADAEQTPTRVQSQVQTQAQTQTQAQALDSSPAVQLSFRLACWQVSDQLLVLDSLQPGERPDARRVTLLGNILKAIGQQPDMLPATEFLDWPLSSGADASLDGARISIHTFLQGRMTLSPFRWVLAMGDAAILSLAPEDLLDNKNPNKSSLQGQSFPLFDKVSVLCVPGLEQMLVEPASKALAWATLQSLLEPAVK
ncbi:MAG: hypothetical protein V7717_03010 [Porticoccaceae bacterium]